MDRGLRFLIRYSVGALVFLIITLGITHYEQNFAERETEVELPMNSKFPRIKHTNQHGDLINYEDFIGKAVIIDFWFGGCKPCLEEMVEFPDLLDKYKNEFVILSYSIDSKEYTANLLDQKEKAWSFLPKHNPNWHFLNVNIADKNDLIQKLGIKAYPTYYLIDKQGKLDKASVSGIYLIENQFESLLFQTKSINKTLKFYKNRVFSKMIVVFHILLVVVLILQTIVFGIRRYVLKQNIRF